MIDPSIALPGHFVPQGISADLIASKYGFSRADADQFASISQQRAGHAWKQGYFNNSVVPVKDINDLIILAHDENVRPKTTPETLAKLKPSFEMMGQMGGFDAVQLPCYQSSPKLHHLQSQKSCLHDECG